MSAARTAADQLGLAVSRLEVLHRSNNVVVRAGDVVLKIGGDIGSIQREAAIAAHAASNHGPVIPPLHDPMTIGDFAVSAWPYRQPDADPGDDTHAARALAALHHSLADLPEPLPRLTDRFDTVQRLLRGPCATAALPDDGRGLLIAAMESTVGDASGTGTVLHAEPHDRNRLVSGGEVLYLDFEATCRGPLEWDLAYLDPEAAEAMWPAHDRDKRTRLSVAVSACVSAFCWRHVTARPDDEEMRWHAAHHLAVVRAAVA